MKYVDLMLSPAVQATTVNNSPSIVVVVGVPSDDVVAGTLSVKGVGHVQVQQSRDNKIRFYAFGLDTASKQKTVKLGRVDSMDEAMTLVADWYAKQTTKHGLKLIAGGKSDVGLH